MTQPDRAPQTITFYRDDPERQAEAVVAFVEELVGELHPWQATFVRHAMDTSAPTVGELRSGVAVGGISGVLIEGDAAPPSPWPDRLLRPGVSVTLHVRGQISWRACRLLFGATHPRARRVKSEYHRRRR